MIKRVSLLIATAALLLGAIALPAQAALRHIDGTVLSKDTSNPTFKVTTRGGSTVRIKVTSSTKFQRIAGGFSGLHKGLAVEVEAQRTANGLVATHVETRGGGGNDNGGHHGGGADDGPNHT